MPMISKRRHLLLQPPNKRLLYLRNNIIILKVARSKISSSNADIHRLSKVLMKRRETIFLMCCHFFYYPDLSAGIYLFKINNRNTRAICEICLQLTIKTPERRHWRRSGFFFFNFEQISHIVLLFLMLTLNK